MKKREHKIYTTKNVKKYIYIITTIKILIKLSIFWVANYFKLLVRPLLVPCARSSMFSYAKISLVDYTCTLKGNGMAVQPCVADNV